MEGANEDCRGPRRGGGGGAAVGTFLGSVSTPGTTDSALPNRVCGVNVKITSPASPSRACLFTQRPPPPSVHSDLALVGLPGSALCPAGVSSWWVRVWAQGRVCRH